LSLTLTRLRRSGRYLYLGCVALLFAGLTLLATADQPLILSDARIESYRELYGDQAARRLTAWQNLIREGSQLNEREKLERVNRFFNQVRFVDDIVHWGKEDYWATPVEFLVSNGGDCEDFSIAKYYTLRAMGVPDQRLSLSYVKALELNQAHMVLTYYPSPTAMPLVLDNLINQIRPANERPDLLHVYTFNGESLWLSKRGQRAELVGTSDRLKPWVQLQSRIESNRVNIQQSQERR
jgi:predicted transglutaminase-like cysteine proteinase